LATCLILKLELKLENVTLQETNPDKAAGVATHVHGCQIIPSCSVGNWNRGLTYAEIVSAAHYPVVFECAGGADALNSALLLSGMGGLVVCFGLSTLSAIRTDLLVTKRLTLRGSIGGTGEFETAMRLLADYGDSAAALVSHEYSASQASIAFEQTLHCAERIKTQLVF
jgi:L-iditol 2-dehydrogenase